MYLLPNEMGFPTVDWPELEGILLGGKEWKPRQARLSLGKAQGRMQPAGPQEGPGVRKWEVTRIPCLFALLLAAHLLSFSLLSRECFPPVLQSPWWDMVTSQLPPLGTSVPAHDRDPHSPSLLSATGPGEGI